MALAKYPKSKEYEGNKHSTKLTRIKRIQTQGFLQNLLLANMKLKLSNAGKKPIKWKSRERPF
jgi:hypothetical protein